MGQHLDDGWVTSCPPLPGVTSDLAVPGGFRGVLVASGGGSTPCHAQSAPLRMAARVDQTSAVSTRLVGRQNPGIRPAHAGHRAQATTQRFSS